MSAALFNGEPAQSISVLHRGLHYGDGVFRTCLIFDYQLIDIERQLKKTIEDAAVLGLTLDRPGQLRAEALQMAQGVSRGVLKIMLLRAEQARGYRDSSAIADRLLCRYKAPTYPESHWQNGIRAFRSAFRLAAQPVLAGVKHLNRLELVMASREWPNNAEEVLLNDEQGRPHCGSRSNLFWVSDGQLRTPSLESSGVAGMTRSKLLELAAELGVAVRIGAGSWEELESSEEAFVCNSLIGIWPLRMLGRRSWAAPGPLTQALMDGLKHPRLADR